MTESPIDRLLRAIDALDVQAAMALMEPDCRLLTVDGRSAEGRESVSALLTDFLGPLRATTHRITAAWHEENVWIAEVESSYELKDSLRTGPLPRAFVLREGQDGITDLHVYGAHEQPLVDHRTGEEGMRIGGRWVPPL